MKRRAAGLGALAVFIAEDPAHVFIAVDAALASEALELTFFERFALRHTYTIPGTRQICLTQRTDLLAVPYAGFPDLHGAVLGAHGSLIAA